MIEIGIISVSDRAFNKVYKDEGIPEIEKIFSRINTFQILKKIIIPDEKETIKEYFYPGSIKLNSQSLLLNNGNELPLQVGMSLQANIKLRRVSYLKLLLGNFRDKAESIKSI